MACLHDRIREKSNFEAVEKKAASFSKNQKVNVGIYKDRLGSTDIYEFEEAKGEKDYIKVIEFSDDKSENVLSDSGRSGKKLKPIKPEKLKSKTGDVDGRLARHTGKVLSDNGSIEVQEIPEANEQEHKGEE